MPAPLVTFYVPVYNGAAYLREALDSISGQTFTDWECIVVDDYSTDASPQILASVHDPRFRVVRQPANLNVANASNLAMSLGRGAYLARLDQDDVAMPGRLERQVQWLEAHPEVAVCGGAVETFGESGGHWYPELEDAAIKANLLEATSVIANPASMVRMDFLKRNGILNDPHFPLSCDYGMWVDCTLAGGNFANLPEVLTRYRLHPGQGSRDTEKMVAGVIEAKTRLLHAWFPDLAHSDVLAFEPLLRVNGTVYLSREAVARGIAACDKAMEPAREAVHGESRERVRAFIGARREHWLAHLKEG